MFHQRLSDLEITSPVAHMYKSCHDLKTVTNNRLRVAKSPKRISDLITRIERYKHWKTSFEKKLFFCVGEYAEYKGFINKSWYGLFVACGIWCLADVSSVSPSSEQSCWSNPYIERYKSLLWRYNSPFPDYASVPANNNLNSRLGARKYSKCMKTGHLASTSSYCSRELKHNSEMILYSIKLKDRRFIVFFLISFVSIIFRGKTFSTDFRASCISGP